MIEITLPPGWEQIWDQGPEESLRFWIRDPQSPLAGRDIPIFSIEYRSQGDREAGAPLGLVMEEPRRRREWGTQESEFAVESKGYACFDDGSGGEYVEYRRVIRRDSAFGQINCEMQSSTREPIFVYRALLAQVCRSAKPVQGR